MKVGILTFHNADNYGAVLQAYGLQQELKNGGVDSEFVNIESTVGNCCESKGTNVIGFLAKILAARRERAEKFAKFREKYLRCSKFYAAGENQGLDKDFDFFIAGSDQVWNYTLPDFDERYFLPFAGAGKRYAYGVSFGMGQLPESVRNNMAQYIQKFDGISVREVSGKMIVDSMVSSPVAVVPDPTLLVGRGGWEVFAKDFSDRRYVLLFLLVNDADLFQRAKATAIRLGLPLKIVCGGFLPQYGLDAWSGVGVSEWVNLMAHASVVFTNSFHGSIFALMFGKRLWTARLKGDMAPKNDRVEQLFGLFGFGGVIDRDFAVVENARFDCTIKPLQVVGRKFLREIVEKVGRK